MDRSPRMNIPLPVPMLEWLRWYAAQSGRTPTAAAARLLERAIEEERARPALARAYAEDGRVWEPGPLVLADIAAAVETPGVADVLGGKVAGSTPSARAAAAYLQQVNSWLLATAAGTPQGPPPRLSAAPALAPSFPDIGEALRLHDAHAPHAVANSTRGGV